MHWRPTLCVFTLQVVNDVHDRFKDLLTSLDLIWLNPESFSAAVHAKGAPLRNCWGFVDGTARPIARPKKHQRIMFSGHKRIHCVKFQVFFLHFYAWKYNTLAFNAINAFMNALIFLFFSLS